MWITRVSIANPVFATMLMIALLVAGLFSYRRLAIEAMPDVDLPYVIVVVQYPGASPEAVENDLAKPIENALNPISGVRSIRTIVREGSVVNVIEFELNVNVAQAIQDVRDKVAVIRPSFPKDAKDPFVSRARDDNEQPVVSIGITSKERSLRDLTSLTQQVIAKRFENVVGVGSVNTTGALAREVQILLRPQQLQAYGVSVEQVLQALRTENADTPAGRVVNEREERLVRVEGRIQRPADFGRIIVARRGGTPVLLSQVADVVDGQAEETSIARINNVRAISIDLIKVQGANIVEVGASVAEALEELRKRLPADVELTVLSDTSKWVKRSVDNVKRTIVEGAILTVLIVFFFLHSWRSTVITGLTLPIAVIGTFTAIYAFGFTLNFLTLLALSLCIGLLIDDAIVVRENIVRHLALGKDHASAAREGTDEIGLAVMATTFSIVAVFAPIAFMGGIIGKFFYQFGLTVVVAVLVSLFVSFTLDPMLSAVWHDPAESRFARVPWMGRMMMRIERWVEAWHRWYGALLGWALDHRGTVIAIATGTFAASLGLLASGLVGSEFQPKQDQGQTVLRLSTPVGSSLQFTEAKVLQVEAIVRAIPEVRLVYANIGTGNGRNTAWLNIHFVERRERTRRQEDLENAIREKVRAVAGVELSIGWQRPIEVSILGPDLGELDRLTTAFARELSVLRGVTEIESSLKASNPTLAVRVNRELASDQGLSVGQIAAAVRPLVAGDAVTQWLGPDGQNYDVRVQAGAGRRRNASDLGEIMLMSSQAGADGSPKMIPLRQVADVVETLSPKRIDRLALQRQVTVTANVEGRPAGDVGSEVEALIKRTELPAGYRFNIGGQQKMMAESFQAAMAALGMAVIFIYLILASQFGSFLQPIAIMMSLPLSLIGVLIALFLSRSTLNIFSIIGFIMLMGLVTKNAILLVDFANQALRQGLGVREAILQAGQVRLRPILMTTLAMIFGMLPSALGSGEGGESSAPMGRAIIGGVISSTLLTLVVVPVIYGWLVRGRGPAGTPTPAVAVQPTAAARPGTADD